MQSDEPDFETKAADVYRPGPIVRLLSTVFGVAPPRIK